MRRSVAPKLAAGHGIPEPVITTGPDDPHIAAFDLIGRKFHATSMSRKKSSSAAGKLDALRPAQRLVKRCRAAGRFLHSRSKHDRRKKQADDGPNGFHCASSIQILMRFYAGTHSVFKYSTSASFWFGGRSVPYSWPRLLLARSLTSYLVPACSASPSVTNPTLA